jgi:DivIVA domain-containing protein
MSDFERPGVTFDQPEKRRSAGSWFSDLSDRITRSFKDVDRPQNRHQPAWQQDEPQEWEPNEEPDDTDAAEQTAAWEPAGKRFPTALHGYDRAAVDEHLDALERELDQLRIRRSPTGVVQAEIERLGEETSAIIKVAHEKATEITRRAQIQADKCVADAAANAVAMTEDANRKLRRLDVETDAVWAERARLLEDTRSVAGALVTLVEEAVERFPEEKSLTQATPRPPAVGSQPLGTGSTFAARSQSPGMESPPAPGSPSPGMGSPPAAGSQSPGVGPPPGVGSPSPASAPYAAPAEDVASEEVPEEPAG